MDKHGKQTMAKSKVKKVAGKAALKLAESPIHNTSGGEMPNPASRHRVLRKDARFAFKK